MQYIEKHPVHQNKQKLIDKNNNLENTKQVEHIYKKGDLVLLRRGMENIYKHLAKVHSAYYKLMIIEQSA